MKALVVDDSQVSRSMVKNIIDTLEVKVEVEFAADGKEAYQKLFVQEGEFQILVLDINMPGMNGDEAIRKCKEDQIQLPYTIIASTENEKGMVLQLLAMGVKDYVLKPYTVDQMKEKLIKALEAQEA